MNKMKTLLLIIPVILVIGVVAFLLFDNTSIKGTYTALQHLELLSQDDGIGFGCLEIYEKEFKWRTYEPDSLDLDVYGTYYYDSKTKSYIFEVDHTNMRGIINNSSLYSPGDTFTLQKSGKNLVSYDMPEIKYSYYQASILANHYGQVDFFIFTQE